MEDNKLKMNENEQCLQDKDIEHVNGGAVINSLKRVCPYCKYTNSTGYNHTAYKCRSCGKLF